MIGKIAYNRTRDGHEYAARRPALHTRARFGENRTGDTLSMKDWKKWSDSHGGGAGTVLFKVKGKLHKYSNGTD